MVRGKIEAIKCEWWANKFAVFVLCTGRVSYWPRPLFIGTILILLSPSVDQSSVHGLMCYPTVCPFGSKPNGKWFKVSLFESAA